MSCADTPCPALTVNSQEWCCFSSAGCVTLQSRYKCSLFACTSHILLQSDLHLSLPLTVSWLSFGSLAQSRSKATVGPSCLFPGSKNHMTLQSGLMPCKVVHCLTNNASLLVLEKQPCHVLPASVLFVCGM